MITTLSYFTRTMGEIYLNGHAVGVFIYNPDLTTHQVTLHNNVRLTTDELKSILQALMDAEANR